MNEFIRAKIAADLNLDLLQFLEDNVLKADILQYMLDEHLVLKQMIEGQYQLPVSDDPCIQAIRKLYADDFLAKFPQHDQNLTAITDRHYIYIEEQLAYILTYKKESFIRQSYVVEFEGHNQTEERSYFQALAKAMEGTIYAEQIDAQDCSLVISQILQAQLNELMENGINPSVVAELIPPQNIHVPENIPQPEILFKIHTAGIEMSAEEYQAVLNNLPVYEAAYQQLIELQLIPVVDNDFYASLMLFGNHDKLQTIHQLLTDCGVATKTNAILLWDEANTLETLQNIKDSGVQISPMNAQAILENPDAYDHAYQTLLALQFIPVAENDVYTSLMLYGNHERLHNIHHLLTDCGIASKANTIVAWNEGYRLNALKMIQLSGIQMSAQNAQAVFDNPQVYEAAYQQLLDLNAAESLYAPFMLFADHEKLQSIYQHLTAGDRVTAENATLLWEREELLVVLTMMTSMGIASKENVRILLDHYQLIEPIITNIDQLEDLTEFETIDLATNLSEQPKTVRSSIFQLIGDISLEIARIIESLVTSIINVKAKISLHYEPANFENSRWHAFPAKVEEGMHVHADHHILSGDQLKTAILSDFKSTLATIDSHEALQKRVDEFKGSDDYIILAKGQGCVTRFFSLETSSLQAVHEIIKEISEKIEANHLNLSL